jgi:hypothetical protein
MKDVQATEEASRERLALQENTILIYLLVGHFVHLDPDIDPADPKSMRIWIHNTAM